MIKGVDVSHYQNVIDWRKVKADGISFAFLKCTEGTDFLDSKFKENKKNAREAGLTLGFYHFARGTDAIGEADWFLQNIGDTLEGEILALDYEIRLVSPAHWCKTFLDRCFEKTGARPLIYLNSSTAQTKDWSEVINGNYGLWIANYSYNDGTLHPNPVIGKFPFYVIHQYTSRGRVKGIYGNVDRNIANVSLETLRKYGIPKKVLNSIVDSKTLLPLADWKTAKRGYTFGQKTWYGTKHLGLDIIVPKGTPVFAWRDVEVTFSQYGYQGGYQCWVMDRGKLVRLMHLQEKPALGKFKSGQVLARTGNTGALTTGAHLHIDISRNGKLELSNFSNFLDPEIYFA